MAFKDLREFIDELEQRGLLKRITAEVDCELEITEITDRVSKMEGEKNVALLFENVKGYDMPVLMNAFGSMERMAIALGVEKLDDVGDELREILKLPYISLQHKMDLVSIIPMARKAINFPKYVKHAPCQEVVITDNPSLDELPILQCWPQDGGKFITLPLVFTKNPETGKRNVATVAVAPQALAKAAGFEIPADRKFIMVESEGIGLQYKFSGEKLTTLLTLYRYDGEFENALKMMDEIYKVAGRGHSCGIYSWNDDHINRLAMRAPVTRVMVRQPQSKANAGSAENGMAMTSSMGCGTWGGNQVSENIALKHYMNYTWVAKPILKDQPAEETLFGEFYDAAVTKEQATC